MVKVCIIVAVSENGVIGKDNQLPWHFPEDLKRFELTLGQPVIMGRNTWDSLPRKPLPGRSNLVVSTQGPLDGVDVPVYNTLEGSIEAAIDIAKAGGVDRVWLIGGKRVYYEGLRHCDELHVTRIKAHIEGDTYLDMQPCGEIWELESCEHVVTASEKNPGLKALFETWVLK